MNNNTETTPETTTTNTASTAVRKPLWKRRRILIPLITLLILALTAYGAAQFFIHKSLNSVEQIAVDEVFPDAATRPAIVEPQNGNKKPLNILFLGSDSRQPGEDLLTATGARTDTMMVLHLSGDRKHADLISIMRDFWVDIPGHGYNKINSAYELGGAKLTIQVVEDLIGVQIDHIALIDFEGFKGITEAVGGVWVNNTIAFKATDPAAGVEGRYYPKGEMKLSGEAALQWVRERKAFGDKQDYQRVKNQQAFMKAALMKMTARTTLANPIKLNNMIDAARGYVATDAGLNSAAIIDLAQTVWNIDPEDFRVLTYPTYGSGWEGEQIVIYINEREIPKIQQAFQTDTVWQYTSPGDQTPR